MKKLFKRFLNNTLLLVIIICAGIFGISLLHMTANFIGAIFSPFVGVLVLVLLIALVLSILITILDILLEDMEEREKDDEN